jgi:cation transport ATPase
VVVSGDGREADGHGMRLAVAEGLEVLVDGAVIIGETSFNERWS